MKIPRYVAHSEDVTNQTNQKERLSFIFFPYWAKNPQSFHPTDTPTGSTVSAACSTHTRARTEEPVPAEPTPDWTGAIPGDMLIFRWLLQLCLWSDQQASAPLAPQQGGCDSLAPVPCHYSFLPQDLYVCLWHLLRLWPCLTGLSLLTGSSFSVMSLHSHFVDQFNPSLLPVVPRYFSSIPLSSSVVGSSYLCPRDGWKEDLGDHGSWL